MKRSGQLTRTQFHAGLAQDLDLGDRLRWAVRDNTAPLGKRLAEVERVATKELRRRSLPARHGWWAVNFAAGLWCEVDEHEPLPARWNRVAFCPTALDPLDTGNSCVDLYLLLRDIAGFRSAVASGATDRAAELAFELGLRVMAWGGIFTRLNAMSGKQRRDNLTQVAGLHNKRRQAASEAERRRCQEEADAVFKKHPDWSKTAVAKQIIKNLGLTKQVRTVRGWIRKVGTAR